MMIRTSAGLPHGGRSSGPKTWGGCRWVRQTPCLPTSEWTAAARLLPPRSQRGARWRVSWRMSARECVGVCEISLSLLLLTTVILLWRVPKSPDSSWTLNSSWMALLLVYSAVTNGTSLHVILPTWKHRKSVYTEAGHCHSQDLLLLTHNGKITHITCNFRAFGRAVSSLHSARLSLQAESSCLVFSALITHDLRLSSSSSSSSSVLLPLSCPLISLFPFSVYPHYFYR